MSSSSSELLLEQSVKAFDGYQYVYSHDSWTLSSQMKFGIYNPLLADTERVPLVIFLSDVACTEQSFITRSGVQRLASNYGFIVANPDTSACAENDQMLSYVNEELYDLISMHFNVDPNRVAILGHGIGGHAALVSFLTCPTQYASVSALAPTYDQGVDKLFAAYDGPIPHAPVLIDQGSDDPCKDDGRRGLANRFLDACARASFPLRLREQIGYDHSEYFLMTFLDDHFRYHKQAFERAD